MRTDQERIPTYGGSNDVIQQTCPRCGKSPDTHKPFPRINTGEDSERLLEQFRNSLDDLSEATIKSNNLREAYLKLATGAGGTVYSTSMMGAAVATIGSKVMGYVALSGPGPAVFSKWIKRNKMPKDTVIIEVTNTLVSGKLLDISLKQFTPIAPVAQGRGRDYPLGSCAAQKLLHRILADAVAANQKVTAIEFCEMFWQDFGAEGHNRDWSTGQIVQSCDTCKQVIPQMLCSNTDD
ncbi:MAG TPA: hypothetical protein VE465_05245 [Streptosporangiaceae bacterium]|jgi:hypothetical protein|nr:hypothetical protein [Streptosporangiaceae bacterium]